MLPTQFRKTYASTARDYSIQKASDSYLELEKSACTTAIAKYLPENEAAPSVTGTACHTEFIPAINVAQVKKTLRHTFRNFCSIGRALDILYTDNDTLLQRVQKEIGFRYIKFHGIFDDALHVYKEDASGDPIYNFYYTDKVIHKILSLHLKPLIQLSFMPHTLAKDPDVTCGTVRFNISEPKDEKKWCDLVENFTRHCIDVFGKEEVESWIFTFWNETLTNQVFSLSSDEIFFHLYKITYDTVKAVDPSIRYATTSFTCTIFPTKRYDRYLSFMERHHCLPDLFLFHFYATAEDFDRNLEKYDKDYVRKYGTTIPLTLSTNPDLLGDYFTSVGNELRPKYDQPFFLTEWGFSPSHREWLNDTVFSSCYIVRNILLNYDRLESFCHWNLTDQLDELEEPEETFHGGTGLFTRNGLPKPAYYAYLFLIKLEDLLLSSGEGYFITTNSNRDRYVILLYHYQHFTDMYAGGILFDADKTNRYAAFSGNDSKKFSLCLTDLSAASCLISETILNRTSGSVYDKWLELGGVEPSTDEDISLLAALSTPETRKRISPIENGMLTIKAVLQSLEVHLIEIQLK